MKKLHIAIITGVGLMCIVISGLILIWYLTVFLDEPGVYYPQSLASYRTTGHFEIDPQSLLSSLEQGDLDIFQLKSGLPEEPSDPPIVVEWTQADYFKIAEAIQQVVWKEAMDDWNLYGMYYMAPCKNEPIGLFYAEFFYFQEVQVKGKSVYSYRGIRIDPRYGNISWGGDTLYKKEIRWDIIDLNDVTIPAEKAMIEAESQGGREFRQSKRNQCSLSIDMNPSSFQRFDWWVLYSAGSYQEFWIPSK